MYKILVREDETIEVDFWSIRIEAGKAHRTQSWQTLLDAWRKCGGVLDFDPEPVRQLFVDLRIDVLRAGALLDARADLTAAPIDVRPEVAMRGENQFIEDEAYNEDMVWDALRDRLGVTSICFGHDADMNRFLDMRDTLRSEGKLKPGILGA